MNVNSNVTLLGLGIVGNYEQLLRFKKCGEHGMKNGTLLSLSFRRKCIHIEHS